jgi:hypothetical protein
LWSTPTVVLLASWLLIVPLVVAATIRSGEERAPRSGDGRALSSGAASRAAALPACTIIGTQGADRLVGTAEDDVICALGGDDVVRGRGGDDVLFGSFGDDVLHGGPGDDQLKGHWGADRLNGSPGADLLHGGGNGDVLSGGSGPDVADYGTRDSSVRVSIGRGARDGVPGEGDDVRGDVEGVRGGSADDTLVGNAASNRLFGRGGDDLLKGGPGNDRLWGGRGVDRLDGRDRNRFRDALDCGAGRPDAAMANVRDHVAANCENVRQPNPPRPDENRAPTDVTLSNSSVAENRPAGTGVGTLSAADRDGGDVHRFALVAGSGGGDNAAFAVEGDELRTAAVFDFETRSSYSVRVRVTDGRGGAFAQALAITVTDVAETVNHAPSEISLSPAAVAENEPVGTTVGTLTAVDADSGQTHAFAFVAGAGDADNGSFAIAGSTLRTAAVLDFETKSSYSVRVRATDNGSPPLAAERVFTITVTDDPTEPPTADAKSVTGVSEDGGPDAIVLSGGDVEGDPLTFAVVAGPQHGDLDTNAPAATCDGATPSSCTASVDYTPDGDFNGADSFTYTVDDGTQNSAPATVSITVDPINDAPVAAPGSRTTDEDAPLALDLAALVSDVETADADLTYTIVAPPAHGTVTGGTYTPDDDFNGTDSLTYEVTDRGDPDGCAAAPCDAPLTSSTETVSITVDPVNDAPLASPASMGVDEDGSLPIDLAALVSDVETADANLTYAIVTPPAHGALTGAGGARTYTPDGDFNGADSFTYEVTDRGDPDNCAAAPCDAPLTSSTQTVSITVNALNDAPVNLLPAGPLVALQDTDTPVTGISVADVDAGADAVELELSVVEGTLTVDTLVPGGVGALQVAGNGSAAVTITASVAQINATLADADGLVYRGDPGYTGPDTMTVSTDDLGHNGAGGPLSDTDTLAITVAPPNAAPVAVAQSVSTGEDTPLTITLSASDADDDPLSFTAGTPSQGSLGAIGPADCAAPNVCTADVLYTPAVDYNGPDNFTFTGNDGVATSAPATVSITVNAVNDAPELENIEAGTLAYTENDPATLVTASTTVADVDSPDFDTGTLTVDYSTGGTADDRLEIANQGQIAVAGSSVTFGGTTIGTFTGGAGTTPLVVTLNADATPVAVQALVRAVAYRNVSEAPSTAPRTVRFVLTDGSGGTSGPATRAIAVTAVNDLPVVDLDAPGGLTYTENAGFQNLPGPNATVTDADSATLDSLTVTIASGFDAAFDTLELNTAGFTANFAGGVLTITRAGGTPADFTTALRNVRFRNTDDDPDDRDDGTPNPAAADRTVQVVADDGPGTSTPVTRAITITPVNDAPGAPSPLPSTASVRNTTLVSGTNTVTDPKVTRTIDLEGNATDPDGPESAIAVVPASAAATAQGGRITLNAAGDLVYEPPASVTLVSDTYGYQLSDGTTASAPITFTVNFAGEVWYVADGAPLPRDGTAARPFDTLAAALAVATTNDAIHIRRAPGDGTLTAGVTLQAGQKLLGEGVALTSASVGAPAGDTLFAAGTEPVLTASGTDVVTLANTTEIAGLSINPDGAAGGLAGTNPTGVTVRDADITDTGTQATQPGIELTTGGGLSFTGTVSVATPAARALALTGTALSGTLASTTAGGTTGGVSLTNTTGNLTFQTLNLTTTGGTGFLLANAANIDVDGAAFATTVSSTGGPAVDATGLTGGTDLVFDTITASGGIKGVNLDGTGGWTFSAGAGSAISGASVVGFDVNGGSGAVSYAGSIANGTGEAVDVTGRTGNTTISGSITGAGGTGVNISGNTAGTTTFSGTTKTLSTGTNAAVTLSSNTGHTISFTGGGLDIDTTSGTGFSATGGGTVSVTGTGNSATATTGTALNVANTTIGASDLNFQSISSNGGSAAGIILDTTGTTGGLTVAGDGTNTTRGGNGSGGTIANKSGADGATTTGNAVYLNSAAQVTLRRMTINGTNANHGILATNSREVALEFSTVNGTNGNNATGSVEEGSITFLGLTVSGAIADSIVGGGFTNNLRLLNTSGTLNRLTISNSTFDQTGSASSNNNLLIEAQNAGTVLNFTLQGSTIRGARADWVNASNNSSSTMDAVVSTNTFSNLGTSANANAAAGGNRLVLGSIGTLTYNIDANTLMGSLGEAMRVRGTGTAAGLTGTATGRITNNTIGAAATANSGSSEGSGIFIFGDGGSDNTALISGNTIRQYNNHAISLTFGDEINNGAVNNVTVTSNNTNTPGTINTDFNGFHLNNGTVGATDDFTTCLELANNNFTAGGKGSVFPNNADVRLRQRQSTTVRLPGYGGPARDDADNEVAEVVTFLRPPASGGVKNNAFGTGAANSVSTGGGYIGTGGACVTPP